MPVRPAARLSRRPAGGLGLIALGSLAFGISAAAAPSVVVPSSRESFPEWLAGPLVGLGPSLPLVALVGLLGLATLGYLAVLRDAAHVPRHWVLGSIVGLHLVFLLAPPVLSTDVFGYIAYGRLEVVHGLDPYTHAIADVGDDPVRRFLAPVWPVGYESPYGPLFTAVTYLLALLGIPSALWGLKLLTVACALATVAAVMRCAPLVGRRPEEAALFVGLNPVWLAWAVGGAHNDVPMVLLATVGVWLFVAGREPLGAAAIVAGAAVKASAGLFLPFALAGTGRSLAAAAGALAGMAAVSAASLLLLGSDALAYPGNVVSQLRHVSGQNIPEQFAIDVLGLERMEPVVSHAATGTFVLVGLLQLTRVLRGAPWIDAAGWTMAAAVVTTTSLQPWYLAALLPAAALARSHRLRIATLLLGGLVVLVELTPQT